jgi:hypothetical protein
MPGHIIAIPDHGSLKIGDALTEGEPVGITDSRISRRRSWGGSKSMTRRSRTMRHTQVIHGVRFQFDPTPGYAARVMHYP